MEPQAAATSSPGMAPARGEQKGLCVSCWRGCLAPVWRYFHWELGGLTHGTGRRHVQAASGLHPPAGPCAPGGVNFPLAGPELKQTSTVKVTKHCNIMETLPWQ